MANISSLLSSKSRKTISSSLGGNVFSASVAAMKVNEVVAPLYRQFSSLQTSLAEKQVRLQQEMLERLAADPTYDGHRNKGVALAWEYEKADIMMGGRGSENWTKTEADQILNSSNHRLRGAEGHHINNVSDHPEGQVDAKNIKFFRTREEHLKYGHDGDFQNESHGKTIDREKMLRRTNFRRTFGKEVAGCAISAALGFGIGFGLSLSLGLYSGLGIRKSLEISLVAGGKSAAIGAVSYIGTRLLMKAGLGITGAGFAVGGLITLASSAIRFAKMVHNGYRVSEAAIVSLKQSIVPICSLSGSFIAALAFGPVGGAIFGVGFSVFFLWKEVRNIAVSKRIDAYVVELHEPKLVGA